MTVLIRKLHIYAGLLVFTYLILYGIAGLVATVHGPGVRSKLAKSVRYVEFSAPPAATDKQVADLVYRKLNLPLTRPVPDWFLRRTSDNHLLLDFYNINGIYRVIVLENERRLRIEDIRNSNWLFLEDVHAITLGDREAPRLLRLWALWNEIAMWALIGFCISGAYLWLASRSRFRWAWAALASGAASLAIFWFLFR
jgi:uncharacterized iron-regulated membrane protein